MIRINGMNPAEVLTDLPFLSLLALTVIYWLMGIAISFCTAVGIGSIVGAIRSLLVLFKSRSAWFAFLTFMFLVLITGNFAEGILTIAGEIGDRTSYHQQWVLIVGFLIPGLFTWFFPVGLLATGGREIAMSSSFRPYGYLYGFVVIYSCAFFGLLLVLMFLVTRLTLGWLCVSLIFYPVTFAISPWVMGIGYGVWIPLLLHYGGLILGGFLFSVGDGTERPNQSPQTTRLPPD